MQQPSKVLVNGFNNVKENTTNTMTIGGTIIKTFILLLVGAISFMYVWNMYNTGNQDLVNKLILIGSISAFIISIVTVINPKISVVTASLYSLAQGVVLGGISASFNQHYDGVALQAVLLTVCILVTMLLLYKTKIIQPTKKFRSMIVLATMGIGVIYLLSFILSLAGIQMPFIHETGLIGIGISLFIIVVASLNLILDFNFIEQSANNNAPSYMEWFGALALVMTLVWIYLELLKILPKLQKLQNGRR